MLGHSDFKLIEIILEILAALSMKCGIPVRDSVRIVYINCFVISCYLFSIISDSS